MREFPVNNLSITIKKMVQEINYAYPRDIHQKLRDSYQHEQQPQAKNTLKLLLDNAELASEKHLPICQDTGMVIVFMEIGQEVHFIDGNYEDAINQGVAAGYDEGYLRKSIVDDPLFTRTNTKTNTPAIIYTSIIPGDQVIMQVTCKGFGSENMSRSILLKPAQGVEGVKEFVLDTVKKAGPNACPPFVVGIGIGGSFDYAAVLAKKATLRDVDSINNNPQYAQLEQLLTKEINQLNIGPQGLHGDTSVFGVAIEHFPTHIAGLPCAVNISCHITRHAKVVL